MLEETHRVPICWSGLRLYLFLHYSCLQCHIPSGALEGPDTYVIYS